MTGAATSGNPVNLNFAHLPLVELAREPYFVLNRLEQLGVGLKHVYSRLGQLHFSIVLSLYCLVPRFPRLKRERVEMERCQSLWERDMGDALLCFAALQSKATKQGQHRVGGLGRAWAEQAQLNS